MKLVIAKEKDLQEILYLQKDCYIEEAELYDDYKIPPLTQTIDSIQKEFKEQQFFKIMDGNNIIASVRILIEGNIGKIGRLIVDQKFRNNGIATRIMKELEMKFINVKRFELFTGHKSIRNLKFYKKLGYKEFKRKIVTENLELIFLEKII